MKTGYLLNFGYIALDESKLYALSKVGGYLNSFKSKWGARTKQFLRIWKKGYDGLKARKTRKTHGDLKWNWFYRKRWSASNLSLLPYVHVNRYHFFSAWRIDWIVLKQELYRIYRTIIVKIYLKPSKCCW